MAERLHSMSARCVGFRMYGNMGIWVAWRLYWRRDL